MFAKQNAQAAATPKEEADFTVTQLVSVPANMMVTFTTPSETEGEPDVKVVKHGLALALCDDGCIRAITADDVLGDVSI